MDYRLSAIHSNRRIFLNQKHYDYIILGAGCAGLSLLVRMLASKHFRNKKFLLVEKEEKKKNDRTWCFWEKEPGFFNSIVFHQWAKLDFISDEYESTLNISPYHYKMIRGFDFYEYCFGEIAKHEGVDMIYGTLPEFLDSQDLRDKNILEIGDHQIEVGNAIVFNSIYHPPSPRKKDIRLLQHFKGWVVETKENFFDQAKATLMDFRVHQDHGTAFTYVLPFSPTKALIEYTLFTPSLLEPSQYDVELNRYITGILGLNDYRISEEEFGIIPMTNQRFEFYENGFYNIGTAGGQTKASSGYTFQFIQKQTKAIVDYLVQGKSLKDIPATPNRFRFYDNTLLHILYHNALPGKKVFTDLFQKNKASRVLKFLDNESSLKEELQIISSLPMWPFLKAALGM